MQDHELRGHFRVAAKCAAYTFVAIAAVWVLFRVIVPILWGMPNDFAFLATAAAAILGSFGVAALVYVMVRDVIRENRADHG